MRRKQISLEVVNPNATGIDIGSRSHWVAVGQNAQDVKEFGVYSQDHQELCEWLKMHQVTTIAMESTGTYWQNLFSSLVVYGFDVILVNGRQTKNIKGKKKMSQYRRTLVEDKRDGGGHSEGQKWMKVTGSRISKKYFQDFLVVASVSINLLPAILDVQLCRKITKTVFFIYFTQQKSLL